MSVRGMEYLAKFLSSGGGLPELRKLCIDDRVGENVDCDGHQEQEKCKRLRVLQPAGT